MAENVRESYNKICGQWSDFCSSRKVNKCIEDFAELLEPQCKILDVGCGTGYPIDDYLANRGFIVTGIDISEEMIKRAESLKLPNAKFFTEDILKFYPDEQYEAIIAFDSLWHIEHDRQEDIYNFIFTYGKRRYAAFYSRKRRRGNYRYDVRREILSQRI